MKNILKRSMAFLMAGFILFTSKDTAFVNADGQSFKQRHFEDIENETHRYLNENNVKLKEFDKDPETIDEANKQVTGGIKDPKDLKTYTTRIDYKISFGDEKIISYQPYIASVGENDKYTDFKENKEKTLPKKDIKLPDLAGFKAPQDKDTVDFNFIKEHSGKDINHIYTSVDKTVKIIHRFQSLKDRNDFKSITPITEYQAGPVGSMLFVQPLDAKKIEGFVPESNSVFSRIPVDTENFSMDFYYYRKPITVTYDTDDGTAIEAKRLYYGQTIPKVKDPTKKGAKFKGWKINQDLYEITDQAENGNQVYTKGEVTTTSEFKNATPYTDIVFTAQWEENKTADYKTSIWSERSDYDEKKVKELKDKGDPSWIRLKYDYINTVTTKDAKTGSTPNLEDTDLSNTKFPDIDLSDSKDKENFKKYYTFNKDLTDSENKQKNKDEQKKVSSTGETVYNVYYDRREYKVIFEKFKEDGFYPEFEKDGVKYDEENIYSCKIRFGEDFLDKWPYAINIKNFPEDKGSLDWYLKGDDDKNEYNGGYRDLQPYRFTKDEFVSPGFTPAKKDSKGNTLDAYTRVLGIDYTDESKVGPLQVDISCQSVEEAKNDKKPEDPKEEFSDLFLHYVKMDTTNSEYSFKSPRLKGFTAYEEKKKVDESIDSFDMEDHFEDRNDKIKEAANKKEGKEKEDLRKLIIRFRKYKNRETTEDEDEDADEDKDEDADASDDDGREYEENSYINFEYKRNKQKIFLNNDPTVIKEINDSAYPDENTKMEVFYGELLSNLDLKDKTPKKPANVPADYVFKGWCIDRACQNLVKDGTETMPDYDITLYAKWDKKDKECKLTFDLDGGKFKRDMEKSDITKDEKNITKLEKTNGQYVYSFLNELDVNEPQIKPVKEGYEFLGWEHVRYKQDGTVDTTYKKTYTVPELYAFENKAVESATLKAIWAENKRVPAIIRHKFYDKDGKDITEEKKELGYDVETKVEPQHLGSYYSAIGKYQGNQNLLRTDKAFLDKLKQEGKTNDYFQSKRLEEDEKKNVFEFHYMPFRQRKYFVGYFSENENGEYNIVGEVENIVNGNRDFDVRNYRKIPGYRLTSKPQQNLLFEVDDSNNLKSINGKEDGLTRDKPLKFIYEDVRVIKRKSQKAITPDGYHRVVFKTDGNGTFKDGEEEIIYDVIDGLEFKHVPVPRIVDMKANKSFSFEKWDKELLDKRTPVKEDYTFTVQFIRLPSPAKTITVSVGSVVDVKDLIDEKTLETFKAENVSFYLEKAVDTTKSTNSNPIKVAITLVYPDKTRLTTYGFVNVVENVIEQTNDTKPDVPDDFVKVVVDSTDKAKEKKEKTFWVKAESEVSISFDKPTGKTVTEDKREVRYRFKNFVQISRVEEENGVKKTILEEKIVNLDKIKFEKKTKEVKIEAFFTEFVDEATEDTQIVNITKYESFKEGNTFKNDFIPTKDEIKKALKLKDEEIEFEEDKEKLYEKLKEKDDTIIQREETFNVDITLKDKTKRKAIVKVNVLKNIYKALIDETRPIYVPKDFVKVVVEPTDLANEQRKVYFVNKDAFVQIPTMAITLRENENLDVKFKNWTLDNDNFDFTNRYKFTKDTQIKAQYDAKAKPEKTYENAQTKILTKGVNENINESEYLNCIQAPKGLKISSIKVLVNPDTSSKGEKIAKLKVYYQNASPKDDELPIKQEDVEVLVKVFENVIETDEKSDVPDYFVKVVVNPTDKAKDEKETTYFVNPNVVVTIPAKEVAGKVYLKNQKGQDLSYVFKAWDKPLTNCFKQDTTINATFILPLTNVDKILDAKSSTITTFEGVYPTDEQYKNALSLPEKATFEILDTTEYPKVDVSKKDDSKDFRMEKAYAKVTFEDKSTKVVSIDVKVLKNIYPALFNGEKTSYTPDNFVKVVVDPTKYSEDSQKKIYFVNPNVNLNIPKENIQAIKDYTFSKWTIEDKDFDFDKEMKFEKETTIKARFTTPITPLTPAKKTTADVIFSKLELGGKKELVGAKLKLLEGEDENGKVLHEWTSSQRPLTLTLQEDKVYTLVEVEAPVPYQKSQNIVFRVQDGDVWQKRPNLTIQMIDPMKQTELKPIAKKSIKVKEVWVGKKPKDIKTKIFLTKDGKRTDKFIQLDETKTSDKFDGLNAIENKKAIKYFIEKEGVVDNRITIGKDVYNVAITGSEKEGYTITNTYQIKAIDISFRTVEKGKDENLVGGVLKLVKGEKESDKLVEQWISTKENKKISLEEGIYTLFEINAPDGYKKSKEITFKVTKQKVLIKEKGIFKDTLGKDKFVIKMQDEKEVNICPNPEPPKPNPEPPQNPQEPQEPQNPQEPENPQNPSDDSQGSGSSQDSGSSESSGHEENSSNKKSNKNRKKLPKTNISSIGFNLSVVSVLLALFAFKKRKIK